MLRRLLGISVLLLTLLCTAAGQTATPKNAPQKNAPSKKTLTEKLAKLAQPWPNAETLQSRRIDAERRALFQMVEPLVFTLESDFSAVNKDRDPNSTKQFPAILKTTGPNGESLSIPIKIGARGHLRRMSQTCSFVPLRLELSKEVKGTAFEGPSNTLKLVTHCQGSKEFDQFVLREHLAYRLANLILPRSFRSRIATVTYADSKTGKAMTTRFGMLLEDDGDVARRLEGRTVALERVVFNDLEKDPLTLMMVFEFMIGNTDFSIFALHNVILVQTPDSKLHPVPYDFDLSGLVRPPYAVGDRRLGMTSVVDRLYRGPCRTNEELQPIFSAFRSKKSEIMATIESHAGLESGARREVTAYINDFFSLIDRPPSVKRFFIDQCNKTAM